MMEELDGTFFALSFLLEDWLNFIRKQYEKISFLHLINLVILMILDNYSFAELSSFRGARWGH